MKASLLHKGIVSYGKTFAITNVARNQSRQQGGEGVSHGTGLQPTMGGVGVVLRRVGCIPLLVRGANP